MLVPSSGDDQHHCLPYDVTPAGVVPSGGTVDVHRLRMLSFSGCQHSGGDVLKFETMIFLVYNNLPVESEERFLKARAPPMPET